MRYLTFRLQITGPAGGQTVHAWSPRGQGRAPFVMPLRAGELEVLKTAFAGPGRNLILESPSVQELSPKTLGSGSSQPSSRRRSSACTSGAWISWTTIPRPACGSS